MEMQALRWPSGASLSQAAVMQSGNCESPFTGFGTMRLALENGEKYVSAIKAKEDEVWSYASVRIDVVMDVWPF